MKRRCSKRYTHSGLKYWNALEYLEKAFPFFATTDDLWYLVTLDVKLRQEAARNACPSGWHLPSDDEWKQLEMFMGMSPSEAAGYNYRGTNEGSKLAENEGLGILEI